MRDELTFPSVGELIAAYQRGSLSPVEVTEQALARMAKTNPVLNAVACPLEQLAPGSRRSQRNRRTGAAHPDRLPAFRCRSRTHSTSAAW